MENENIKVVASYGRKISHSVYGGHQYESSDFFASLSETLPPNTPPEALQTAYNALYSQCKGLVLLEVAETVRELNRNNPQWEKVALHTIKILKGDKYSFTADQWEEYTKDMKNLIHQAELHVARYERSGDGRLKINIEKDESI